MKKTTTIHRDKGTGEVSVLEDLIRWNSAESRVRYALACTHWSELVSAGSSDFDFPRDEHTCPTCGKLVTMHPALIAKLEEV